MIHHRINGLNHAIQVSLLTLNLLLILSLFQMELQFEWLGMKYNERFPLYLLSVPFMLYTNRHSIAKYAGKRADIVSAMSTAFRMAGMQAFFLFGLYFFLKDVAISRFFLLMCVAGGFVLNCVALRLLPSALRALVFRKDNHLRAIVYGHGPLPSGLKAYLQEVEEKGIRLLGYYADEELALGGTEWLGTSSDFLHCEGGRKRIRAELAFTYSDDLGNEIFRENVDLAMERGVRVHIYSFLGEHFHDPVNLEVDGETPFISFQDEPLQNPVNYTVKRVFDILFALPVVLTVLPLLIAFVWIGQALQSPGPLFFRQTRYGRHRRPFTILKFRSMREHDPKLEAVQATKGDSRVYPLGAILRRSSLDEFPQFWNVLVGEMSVVGPRPHMTVHDDAFEGHVHRYRSRHYIKPGITGLAQVNGYRGEAKNPEALAGRIRCDIEYITEWSLIRDCAIILKTVWQIVFPPKSAY